MIVALFAIFFLHIGNGSSDGGDGNGIQLDEDLYNRVLAHAGTMIAHDATITDRLRNGERWRL